jgi:uncharacterized protein (DUF2062 family)
LTAPFRKLAVAILDLLRQGLTPEKIAMAIAVSIALSTFPVLGSTTLLCIATSSLFGLNLAAMQLVSWLAYPLQLNLFVPLLRLGSKIVHSDVPIPSLVTIGKMLASDLFGTIRIFWPATMGAILAWCLASPAVIIAIYWLTIFPIRRLARAIVRR